VAVLILAHRGASKDAPENTIAAFKEAAAQGADGVELDVMVCGSGEVVVCHDEWLGRLTGQELEVRRTPLWTLQALDVGGHLGFGAFATIPTLEEVFAALPEHMMVNIELKSESAYDGGLARMVGEYLERARLTDRVLVSSFNPLCLARLATRLPSVRRGYLIDPEKWFWFHDAVVRPFCANYSVHPPAAACTEARMRRWASLGLKVAAWTVDDPAEAARLKALGAAYCITNRPRVLREALAAKP
jgi:glycerophosphoryl diester phosphodiesterase